jgi:hypothetical protein
MDELLNALSDKSNNTIIDVSDENKSSAGDD